jgi:uncharacterized metal-binding protein YceD (DUF177 family)
MKVRISDLPPQGIKINETISLEALNTRMAEGRGNDIEFSAAPLVNIEIVPNSHGAVISGTVQTRLKQPCSRCLEAVERPLEVRADFVLKPKPKHLNKDAAGAEDPLDDVGLLYYGEDGIELEEALQENLILALYPYWHPPCDAQGKCQLCGLNVPGVSASVEDAAKPVSLGDLLKKAGLH